METKISRSAFLELGFATILLPAFAGCSPAPVPVSSSSKDPSSPNAPEGMNPMSAPAGDAGTDGVVYVCPMHPEVTSTTPGSVCPKCNMKLVPKK